MGVLWITLIVLGSLIVLLLLLRFTPLGKLFASTVGPLLMKIPWVRRRAAKRMRRELSTPEGLDRLMRSEDPAMRAMAQRIRKMPPRERRQTIEMIVRMTAGAKEKVEAPSLGRAQKRQESSRIAKAPPQAKPPPRRKRSSRSRRG